ncbi:MAG: hypothetical protein P8J70_07975 [Glaciecola sp.]|jgi:hypothetical protein|nr:hypothetical protein [Glaciecola sp.]MDG2099598.1 hypothetical protein [Glaciecola sp.]
MNRNNFNVLVWISLLWILIALASAFVAPTELNSILLQQLSLQLQQPLTAVDSVHLIVVLLCLACNVGLLFYKSCARTGYLMLIPITMVLTFMDGPWTYTSIDSFVNDIDIFISGVLWSVLLFTDIKLEFDTQNDFRNHETQPL